MRYSFMSFSTPELGLFDMLETARRFGYDGIEPRLDANHAHGVEVNTTADERKRIGKQARDAGIEIACLATSLSYADPAKSEDMVRQTHERIDLAADVGAPAIRVFGGRLPEGVTREQAIDLLVSSLGAVAEHAAGREVVICLETHDDWCDPNNVAAVLGRVNHPAVRANWDIMHPVRSGNSTIDDSFRILKPWIRHLHIHDGAGTGPEFKLVPIGSGEIDHQRAVELLTEMGYSGFLSGEWIKWEPYEIHLPRELATMKKYEQEL